MRIHFHPPDGTTEEMVEMSEGEMLLVGRDPDPTTLNLEPATRIAVRRLQIAASLVSGNHTLVWLDEAGLHARDLRSKNGTYVRVERDGVVSLQSAHEAHFFLSAPRAPARDAALRDVAVADMDAAPDVFAARVKDAVAEWLAQSGLSATLTLVSVESSKGGAAEPGFEDTRFTVPVVEGVALEIADKDIGRTQVRWDGVKARVFAYVHEQVAQRRACRVAQARGALAFRAPAAARAFREVLDAARLRLPLVLRGESGTGKTALAAIYAGRESNRTGRSGALAGADGAAPFVTVHCAHLDPPLAHSALFGALKGSYTSAERTIVGAVTRAHGGVLFLDDIDALPLETQAKFLRFLDEGQYEPLGHAQREPLVADVRVVAGTNADLRAAVRERRFREDLYWRLHMGAVVRVPPLRERPEDVEQLLRSSPGDSAFDDGPRAQAPRRGSRGDPSRPARSVYDRLEASAVELLLLRHAWRGNFRECLRFCARVRMEPPAEGPFDRRRCEEILAEASLDSEPPPEGPTAEPVVEEGGAAFDRALRQAVRWWIESEGNAPERFDELIRFCETYLKSSFVAHALGLADADARPESFDRERRQRLGCDLTTLKRKVDDYVALKQGLPRDDTAR